ncbi:MAG: carbohydrate ABC transporter permease [Acidimicrobiales bacterium]|jgi:multiple sugar transport system permease protein
MTLHESAATGSVATAIDDEPIRPPENRQTQRSFVRRLTLHTILGGIGILFLAPMLWLFLASIDSHASWGIEWPHFSLINFRHVLTGSLLHSLWNSVVLAFISTTIASVAGVFAAYALSRRRIPFKGPLILFIIFSSGVPLAIMVIPVYEIFSKFGFLSILPTAVFLSVTSLPFEVYLMKNFIDAVPTDLEEAARMERASTFQVLRRVVIPLALPGITAAAIFGFVNAWGSFVVPLILISPTNQQPAPIAIYTFLTLPKAQFGNIAAYSLIFCVPVFILYAVSARLFREGFVLGGGVKG